MLRCEKQKPFLKQFDVQDFSLLDADWDVFVAKTGAARR
jgi:hypothetical protein